MVLLNVSDKINIHDTDSLRFTTFDFTSLYANITHQNTIHTIITSCKLLNVPCIYRDYPLNHNNLINQRNFFLPGDTIFQQIKGVPMGRYHSQQIAYLVLLLSKFSFFYQD